MANPNTIKVELKGLSEVLGKLGALDAAGHTRVKQAVGISALDIQREARNNVRVDTGALKKSITVQFYNDGLTAEIAPHMPYAAAVEHGSKPHEIVAKGKALRFPRRAEGAGPKGGRKYRLGKGGTTYNPHSERSEFVFVKRVQHPGTRAYPYMHPAWETVRPVYQERIKQALNQAVRDASKE